jgi:propanol-preferring alcohol dehydrogenase
MQACVLQSPAPVEKRPLRFMNVEMPSPREGEALIKVRACGVCRTDLHVVEGELDQARQKKPVIPGHQVVGEIVQMSASKPVAAPARSVTDVGKFSAPSRSTATDKDAVRVGSRVGVAWLNCTCGVCRFCAKNRENLCERAEFTGWTRDGGYAQYIVAPIDFIYPLPQSMTDEQLAPLLCAGIIGYRCLRLTGFDFASQTQAAARAGPSAAPSDIPRSWSGLKLGIYGFGAAGHIAIQIARFRGANVYVFTRDRQRHQQLAKELGATFVGDTFDPPPDGVALDASIIFAPAGEIVPAALKVLDKGGTLVLGGIHMSPIPKLPYELIYDERVIRSVANNTRQDGRAFLEEAARAGVKTNVESFPLEKANEALIALKRDAIKGAAVLHIL